MELYSRTGITKWCRLTYLSLPRLSLFSGSVYRILSNKNYYSPFVRREACTKIKGKNIILSYEYFFSKWNTVHLHLSCYCWAVIGYCPIQRNDFDVFSSVVYRWSEMSQFYCCSVSADLVIAAWLWFDTRSLLLSWSSFMPWRYSCSANDWVQIGYSCSIIGYTLCMLTTDVLYLMFDCTYSRPKKIMIILKLNFAMFKQPKS